MGIQEYHTFYDYMKQANLTASEEDYIEMCAERAREEARMTLARHLRPFEMVKEYFYPGNMTESEFVKCLEEMSKPK